jgi:hypothetical protein
MSHPAKQARHWLVMTDLDGTLLHSEGTFSAANLAVLQALGRQRILRCIATGRSLYSALRVLPPTFPIDYLIFSSGAGIVEWPTQQLLVAHHLSRTEVAAVVRLLTEVRLDFMVHRPIPDNHYFAYQSTGRDNPDFVRRCQRYRDFATPFTAASQCETACQVLAIDPRDGPRSHYESVKQQLPELKVIRSTSPLDGRSTWIEIFPPAVSKGRAGAWLARQHKLAPDHVLALGNDYNDLDLLRWAGQSFVVSNAPADLKQQYRSVRSNNDDGFAEAVNLWMQAISGD